MTSDSAEGPIEGDFVLVLNGPNLNLLGTREPGVTAARPSPRSWPTLKLWPTPRIHRCGSSTSNPTTRAIWSTRFRRSAQSAAGIIINPAALTHYSIALRDALAAVGAPRSRFISPISTRARSSVIILWWHRSSLGQIAGLGPDGYRLALHHLIARRGSFREAKR